MRICYHLLLLLLFLTGSFHSPAQQLTYRNPADSAANYFLCYLPEKESTGMLLLLPGFGETPMAAAEETQLPAAAVKEGLICILASLPQGRQTFYIDSTSQKHLDELIEELYHTYALAGKKFYLGGFSLGGSGAVKYAQRAAQNKQLKQPHAIFAIDSPLDFERFYRSQKKAIAADFNDVAVQEALYFEARLRKEFKATPAEDLKSYYQLSPFSASDPGQGAARLLKSQPVLLISEPALQWQQAKRGRSFEDLNASDCEKLIQQLQALGNKNAVLLFTKNKGFRKRHSGYHPHAWSIAKAEETVQWLLKY